MNSTPSFASPVSSTPLLRVRNLTKDFETSGDLMGRRVTTRAVDGVSFDVFASQRLGVVGESGSGKTTLARCIARAVTPTAGDLLFQRDDGSVVNLATLSDSALVPLRTELQMIFQNPYASLNPRLTAGEIVEEPLTIHRIGSRREREARAREMLELVGLNPNHHLRYPHSFSGGQRQRIGIARALITRPSLVIADEAVSALDVSIQAQILSLLQNLQREFRLTYIFVSHNLDVVRHFCDRVAVMYSGRLVELAPSAALFSDPRHPYTQMLISSIPSLDPDRKLAPRATAFDGDGRGQGCRFGARCPAHHTRCGTEPLLREVEAGHFVACHL